MLCPDGDRVTDVSLELHVLVAQIYLRKKDIVKRIQSYLDDHGPNDLSTPVKWTRSTLLFGGFLEAAIWTSNLELLQLLIEHQVDVTKSKNHRKDDSLRPKLRESAYGSRFLKTAIHAGDVAIVNELLKHSFDVRGAPSKMILLAVCSGQRELTLALLARYSPPR